MPVYQGRLPVYLIHWNRPTWCASAVASLLASEGVAPVVTVVDNGQEDGPVLEAILPAGTRLIRMPKNQGYAGAANAALADWMAVHPASEFCVLGSHDLHVEPRTLATLLAHAQAEPGYGVVAPTLVGPICSSGGIWTRRGAWQLPPVQVPGIVARDWASGTCLLLRAICVKTVGCFDEKIGSYLEDVDFCLRARDCGWRIGVATDAVAWGLGTASEVAGSMIESNTVVLVAKREGGAAALMTLGSLLVHTLRSALGTCAWWRPPERRQESLAFLRRHLEALRLLHAHIDAPGRHKSVVAPANCRR
jgi:GT2 family glycosyltransferase